MGVELVFMGIDLVAMIGNEILVVFELLFVGVDLVVDQTDLCFEIYHEGL